MKRTWLCWSSGKDSAWALHELRNAPDVQVVGLLTTFNQAFDRAAMHAVRRSLVQEQAERAGLPLLTVDLPWPCSNETYEALMSAVCRRALDAGVTAMAFGDLFLEDVRAYRERQLAPTGLEALFPLWRRNTADLASEMIAAGVKAKITCVDPRHLDRSFAGRDFDRAFLHSLPAEIDPCGENGEFHTFVYDSPAFSSPILIESGDVVERDGFVFADILNACEQTRVSI
jgi:uncharacterized protein (TIGR00290 family)